MTKNGGRRCGFGDGTLVPDESGFSVPPIHFANAGNCIRKSRSISFGFCWAPPGMLVDAIGPGRTIVMLERAQLAVPDALLHAAVLQRPMFVEPIDPAKFFPVRRAVAA